MSIPRSGDRTPVPAAESVSSDSKTDPNQHSKLLRAARPKPRFLFQSAPQTRPLAFHGHSTGKVPLGQRLPQRGS